MRGSAAVVCLLIAAGIVGYVNSLGSPFVFDDLDAIVRNTFITSLWPLSEAMSAPGPSAVAGRPLVSLSLAISYALGGLSSVAFRIWNVGVLIATALLLFGVVRRTARRVGDVAVSGELLAAAAALLWLLHPLQTEVVNYVVQRTESMMGLFYMLTLYAAIRAIEDESRMSRWAMVSVAACAFGMACKESMVTAPVMVLLYDIVFGARSFGTAMRRRGGLYFGLASTWLLLGVLVAEAPRARSAGFSSGVSVWTYLLNQAVMIVTYLRLSIWPHPLVLDYGPTLPIAFAAALPYAIAVVVLLAAVVVAWFRWRPIAYLGAWFFGTLAPSSSVIPIATEVGAERRMYLPLAAVVILALLGVRAAAKRWLGGSGMRQPTLAMAVIGAIALVLGSLTVARNREYRDPVGIWQTVLERRPHGRAHYNMAIALKEQGETAEAVAHYRVAVEDEPAAHYALGFELGSAGQFEEAAEHLREFLRLQPEDIVAPQASFLLGHSLANLGQPVEAERAFRETLRMAPRDADARGGLADVLLTQQRYDEAIGLYREYLTLSPGNAGVHHNLGLALFSTGKEEEAVPQFERAVALNPSDPSLRLSLGNALASTEQLDEAIGQYRTGLELNPADARMMSALGLALAFSGEFDESVAIFRRALELEPDNPDIQSDYGMATRLRVTAPPR